MTGHFSGQTMTEKCEKAARKTSKNVRTHAVFPDFSSFFIRLLGPGIRPNGVNSVRRSLFNINWGDLLNCQKQIAF